MHKTCDINHNIDFNCYLHSACLQLEEGDASFVLFIGYCAFDGIYQSLPKLWQTLQSMLQCVLIGRFIVQSRADLD